MPITVGELCREDGKLKLVPVKRNWAALVGRDPETSDCKPRRRLMLNGQTIEKRRKEEYWKRITEEWSNKALDVYNERHGGAEFELVEPLSVNFFFDDGYWIHVNFKAKPKNGDCNDSSPKFFFAELGRNCPGHDEDTCCIVDPNSPGITDSCGGCNPRMERKIYHPVDGFRAGHFPFIEPFIFGDCVLI